MKPACLFVCVLFACAPAAVAEMTLSEKYPDDAGIAKDADVLFAEDFESGDLKKWDERKGPVEVVGAGAHAGKHSVAMPMHRGKDQGGHLIKWFMPGTDTVHVRFYVKFSRDYTHHHHFVTLLANQRGNRWSAFGKAGLKPDGTYFSSGMECWFAWGKNPPPGELHLYTYYLDMEPDRRMDKYWGNSFFAPGPAKGQAASETRIIPKLDQWQCWEFMVQANTASDKADGRQMMWLDGKLVGEFTGIRWRNDADLKVNALWLQHYGYDSSDPTKGFWQNEQTALFDDIVVAERYVGPKSRRRTK
jgi:hypothetical protein